MKNKGMIEKMVTKIETTTFHFFLFENNVFIDTQERKIDAISIDFADCNLGFGSFDIFTRSIAFIIHCIHRFIFK